MTRHVFIAGYYGAGNAGDEWILNGLLSELRRRDPGIESRVLSYTPEATQREHGVEAIGWGDIEALADAVRWSSLVIVGGGGLWQDYWGFDAHAFLTSRADVLTAFGTPVIIAYLLGRPCALLGVGVGPLQTDIGRKAMRDLAAMSGHVSVRDAHSLREITACGVDPDRVHLGADLAFLAEPRPSAGVRSSGAPTLGVNLRPWPFTGKESDREAEIADALHSWCITNEDGRVVLVPLHESKEALEDDRAVVYRVAKAIGVSGRVEVAPAELPWADRLDALVNSDLVLGMRYHAIVAALRAEIPCVALAYDPKVRSLMQEAGAAQSVCEIPGVTASAIVGHLLAHRRATDPQSVDGLRVRSREAVDKALELERAGAVPVPGLLGDFVIGQSTHLARLLRTIQDLSIIPSQRGPVVAPGFLSLGEAPVEIKRIAAQRDEALARAADTSDQLAGLRATVGVRLLDRYWRAMGRLAPQGSKRRRLYRMLGSGLRERLPILVGSPTRWREARLHALGGRWPADRRVGLPGDEAWLQSLEGYICGDPAGTPPGVMVVLAGTRYEGSEGQRSYHLARAFARSHWKVVFGYWRWEADTAHPQSSSQGGVFEIPLDVLLSNPDRMPAAPYPGSGLILLEFPLPSAMRLLAAANAKGYVTVYDAVDDWAAFHAAGQAPWYENGCEAALGGECDAILAASTKLVGLVGESCGRKVHLVPNGWSPDGEAPSGQAKVERGTITLGYFGHLTEAWFDWKLLLKCAGLRPDWRVHLIGYGGGRHTSQLPGNVVYHGKLPRASLPSHASQWDVGIIPFREGAIAAAADPIKTYEYLSLGLPVVATGVRAPVGAENLVQIAQDAGSFVRAVEEAACSAEARVAERRSFVASSTWERRAEAIQLLLESDEPRIVSKRDLFGGGP